MSDTRASSFHNNLKMLDSETHWMFLFTDNSMIWHVIGKWTRILQYENAKFVIKFFYYICWLHPVMPPEMNFGVGGMRFLFWKVWLWCWPKRLWSCVDMISNYHSTACQQPNADCQQRIWVFVWPTLHGFTYFVAITMYNANIHWHWWYSVTQTGQLLSAPAAHLVGWYG